MVSSFPQQTYPMQHLPGMRAALQQFFHVLQAGEEMKVAAIRKMSVPRLPLLVGRSADW
jgi:hypothetical protein